MSDMHIQFQPPSEAELDAMRDLIGMFIFPNTPQTEEEKSAFDKAVRYQIDHEKTIAERCGENSVPQGVTSFAIGDFSMTFDDDASSSKLTRKNICPYAYSVLLRAGLLYRGVCGVC